jgi:hypothetical protein
MKSPSLLTSLASLLTLTTSVHAAPIGTTFTYQGRLGDAGQPANGAYDLQFSLRDALTGGAQNGGPLVIEDVTVQNGLFTVTLDFGGDAFSEGARWLEIGVRPGTQTAAFTLLSPRQAVTATPLALHALHADTAAQATTALSATTATNATNANKAASADAVTWNNVSGLPAGFADGTDNDTLYTAGAGLTLGVGNQFALNFAGSGSLNTPARSDHSHFGALWSGTSGNSALTLTNTATDGLGGLFKQGTGSGVVPLPGGITAGLWADAHDGPALLGTSLDSSGAIIGQSAGNASGATGVAGLSAATTGRGVYGHATAFSGALGTGAYGVVGESESPSGAGIKAIGAGTTSAALEIQTGGIKIKGAGVHSPTPVFIHEATEASLIGANEFWPDWHTYIDHPLCNNRPNAILILTPREDAFEEGDSHGTLVARYDATAGRWGISVQSDFFDDYDAAYRIEVGARFNVLVFNP